MSSRIGKITQNEKEIDDWRKQIKAKSTIKMSVSFFIQTSEGIFKKAVNSEIPHQIFDEMANKEREPASESNHDKEDNSVQDNSNVSKDNEAKKRDVSKILHNWSGGKWKLASKGRYHFRDFTRFMKRFKQTCSVIDVLDDDAIMLAILRQQADDRALKIMDTAIKELQLKTAKHTFQDIVEWILAFFKANCNLLTEKQLLHRMKQHHNETFSEFITRIQDQAEFCGYSEEMEMGEVKEVVVSNCTNHEQLYRMTCQEQDTSKNQSSKISSKTSKVPEDLPK